MEDKADGGGKINPAKKAVEALVHAADALEPGDGFLTDIAAFVEIDGVLFESGFLGECVFGKFGAPSRHAVDDAEEFDVGRPEFGEVSGKFGGILAEEVESRNNEGGGGERSVFETRSEFRYGGWQGGEEVVERVRDFDGEEFGVVGDEVALEAGLEGVGEDGGGFEEEGIGGLAPDEERGAEFSFCGEEAGGAGLGGLEAGDIDADLAVEIAEGVGATEFESGAVADLEVAGKRGGGRHGGRPSRGGVHFFQPRRPQRLAKFLTGAGADCDSPERDSPRGVGSEACGMRPV
jgi:hypothetical protein